MRIEINRLPQYCIKTTLKDFYSEEDIEEFIAIINIEVLSNELQRFLMDKTIKEFIEIEDVSGLTQNNETLESLVYKSKNNKQLYFFEFKDCIFKSWISWIGLALSLLDPKSLVIPGIEIAKNLFQNFKKLESPKDDDKIHITTTLLKLKASLKTQNSNSITLSEINNHLKWDEELLKHTLIELTDLKIVLIKPSIVKTDILDLTAIIELVI
ncbi:MAG: hypothetical protein IPH57_11455 [Saprospiraceae bacterium]|nr:hypothetical protein [Saprospiraceae bacterium]